MAFIKNIEHETVLPLAEDVYKRQVPALQYCRMLLPMDIRSWRRTGTLTHGRNTAP